MSCNCLFSAFGGQRWNRQCSERCIRLSLAWAVPRCSFGQLLHFYMQVFGGEKRDRWLFRHYKIVFFAREFSFENFQVRSCGKIVPQLTNFWLQEHNATLHHRLGSMFILVWSPNPELYLCQQATDSDCRERKEYEFKGFLFVAVIFNLCIILWED